MLKRNPIIRAAWPTKRAALAPEVPLASSWSRFKSDVAARLLFLRSSSQSELGIVDVLAVVVRLAGVGVREHLNSGRCFASITHVRGIANSVGYAGMCRRLHEYDAQWSDSRHATAVRAK
eukprot:6196912-Pleurochrysis_carterae.AAC.3